MFADFGDRLSVVPAEELSIDVTGRFAGQVPGGPENLVTSVAAALRDTCGIMAGASIRLEKNLPAGAGLGGGSSDAAAVLKILNRIWRTGLDLSDLMQLGGRFGADIPMCLQGSALRAGQTGDSLQPWPDAPALPMVLAWPARPVSTGAVFAGLGSAANPPIPEIDPGSVRTIEALVDLLVGLRNDLTPAAMAMQPAIGEVLRALDARPHCRLSRMSGSGSACFGLFATAAQADDAAAALSRTHGSWWVKAVTAR